MYVWTVDFYGMCRVESGEWRLKGRGREEEEEGRVRIHSTIEMDGWMGG